MKNERDPKALEKLRKLGQRYPELAPLLDTCRTVEEIEEAIRELSKMD